MPAIPANSNRRPLRAQLFADSGYAHDGRGPLARGSSLAAEVLMNLILAVLRLLGRGAVRGGRALGRGVIAAPGAIIDGTTAAARGTGLALKGLALSPFRAAGAVLGAVAAPVTSAIAGAPRRVVGGGGAPALAEQQTAAPTQIDVAQDVVRAAKRMALGVGLPETLTQRLPAAQREWLQSLDTGELELVGRASPARLEQHLSGTRPLVGIPSAEELAVRSTVRAEGERRAEVVATSPVAGRIRARRAATALDLTSLDYSAAA